MILMQPPSWEGTDYTVREIWALAPPLSAPLPSPILQPELAGLYDAGIVLIQRGTSQRGPMLGETEAPIRQLHTQAANAGAALTARDSIKGNSHGGPPASIAPVDRST